MELFIIEVSLSTLYKCLLRMSYYLGPRNKVEGKHVSPFIEHAVQSDGEDNINEQRNIKYIPEAVKCKEKQ